MSPRGVEPRLTGPKPIVLSITPRAQIDEKLSKVSFLYVICLIKKWY